jgi:hypothetical protein
VSDVGGSGIAGYKVYLAGTAGGAHYDELLVSGGLITTTSCYVPYTTIDAIEGWIVRAIDNAGNVSAAGVWGP